MASAGQVVLATGGGEGIGKAIANAFAREGVAVVIADIDVAAAEKLALDIADEGGISLPIVEMLPKSTEWFPRP